MKSKSEIHIGALCTYKKYKLRAMLKIGILYLQKLGWCYYSQGIGPQVANEGASTVCR